jgi:hypothetical protein
LCAGLQVCKGGISGVKVHNGICAQGP